MGELYVKKKQEDDIYLAEDKYLSPFLLFLKHNGRLLFVITMLLAISIFVIGFYIVINDVKESKIVMYETNGVEVTFDGTDSSIINGLPVTKDYANKVFNSNIYNISDNNKGVVIRVKEVSFKNGKIVFYSDNTALVKYNDGSYMRVFPVENNYGIKENGIIDKNATTKRLTGEEKDNKSLGIKMLYLSDGSVEVTKGNSVIFVRNSDLTSDGDKFYTNLSMVEVPVKKEGNKTYYSNGTIKENNSIIVDNQTYNVKETKKVTKDITIIYYENGYAEIIKDNLSIIVEKSDHIVYDNNKLEIIDNTNDKENNEEIDPKDVMDLKSINIKNTNDKKANYIVLLEETSDYSKHNITKRLEPKYINYNVYVNGITNNNVILQDSILDNNKYKLNITNTSYILYEGQLNPYSEANIKLGMWISYEDVTNEYMNSALIGTVKVYVESLS